MKRRHLLITALSVIPLKLFSGIRNAGLSRTNKGFVIAYGEARFGEHFRLKGVTLNKLVIKISMSSIWMVGWQEMEIPYKRLMKFAKILLEP